MGAYDAVRVGVVNQMTSMLTQGKDPKKALADAADEGNQEIEAYNARVG
jgi:hypothetical protein